MLMKWLLSLLEPPSGHKMHIADVMRGVESLGASNKPTMVVESVQEAPTMPVL